MRFTQSALLAVALLCLPSANWAGESVRFEGGDGHLGMQADPSSPWRMVHPADELPARSRLRTSPVGVTRIGLPSGILFLCADTEVDLDVAAQQIQLRRGKLRLAVDTKAMGEWQAKVGRHTVICPGDTEIAVASNVEPAEINVLHGTARVRDNKAELGAFAAPAADVVRHENPQDAAVAANRALEWSRRIRTASEPRPAQGLGQLIARDVQSGNPVRLEVARYHVNVVLKPPVALVQIDQSFFNPHGGQQEGTFVFNLPTGASVSRFAMYVTHDRLIEGELIERQRADNVYTTIVRTRRDPAILEQIGDNQFRMRVFPIPAQDTKRILLDYTLPLAADQGQYRFELPLMSDLKPIWDFALSGTIHPPLAESSVSSLTHPELKFVTQPNGAVTFHSNQHYVQPPPGFSLRYAAAQDSKPSVQTCTLPESAGDAARQFIVVTVPEGMNPSAAESIRPTDVLLLVDTSGQSRNLSRATMIVRTLIAGLHSDDRVQLGCVDVAYRPLTKGWLPVGSPDIEAALNGLSEQFALGASEIDAVLPRAREAFQDSAKQRRRVVVYVGGGPTNQEGAAPVLEKHDPRPAEGTDPVFVAIRTGSNSSGRSWLLRQTTRTGGLMFDVEEKADAMGDLYEWSLTGLPSATSVDSVQVDGVAPGDLFHAAFWPRGRELHLYGRGTFEKAVSVTLAAGGQAAQSFNVETATGTDEDSVFAGRQWAQQKLLSLLGGPGARTTEVSGEIIRLCQEWSLMSPLTAFLVLESEQDYLTWNIDRKLRHRYWQPAGAVAATPLPFGQQVQGTVPAGRPNEPQPEESPIRREVRRLLGVAERALKRDLPERAMEVLSAIRTPAQLHEPATYNDLYRRAQQKLRPGISLSELKLWRPVADRRSAEMFPPSTPLLLQFAHGGFSGEFLEQHPHARQLLKKVSDLPEQMTVEELAKFVQQQTGVPVVVETEALNDEGIAVNQHVDLQDLEGICVRSLLNEALGPLTLGYVPERHLLRITTQTRADELMITAVYPVGDLIQPDPLPPAHRLANPYLDLEETTRRQLESKLKTVVSVELQNTTLDVALGNIGKQIGTRIRIDKQSLSDEGLNIDHIVSSQLPKVPAEVALREVLNPLGLTMVIENEVLKVTTQSRAGEKFDIRLYSNAGLAEEKPSGRSAAMAYGWGGMGGGGMGGMGWGGFRGGMSFGNGWGPAGQSGVPISLSNASSEASVDAFDLDQPVSNETSRRVRTTEPTAAEDDALDFSVRSRFMGASPSGLSILQESNSGRWDNVDGDGGDMAYFPLTQSFVVRQTTKAHRELADTFLQLRRQLSHPYVQRPGKIDTPETGLATLVNVLRTCTFVGYPFDGHSSTPNLATKTLTVRDSVDGHEKVSKLLAQLRRARYLAESLPYRRSLEGIDDLSLIDLPTFTELPRNQTAGRPVITPVEEKILSVRRVPAAISQRWRSVSSATSHKREFAIRRDEKRLELVLADRTLRAEGPRAAVVYPGLSLVEIDLWGNATRQLADAALPWLPHRSNEELAALFDVSAVEEDSRTVTLRWSFPGIAGTYLQPTFSKLTRMPVRWLAVAGNQEQFELQFDLKVVVALDRDGNELERWELVADEAPKPIPALVEKWGDSLVVDAALPDTLFSKARESLRRDDYADAIRKLTRALEERPNQPLLNFLMAWSGEYVGSSDAATARSMRAALERVAISDAEDLLRMMTPANFPSLGEGGLYDILAAIPIDRRSSEVWYQLAELAHNENKYELALSLLNQVLKSPVDAETWTRRQLLRMELLLRTNNRQEAEDLVQQWDEQDLSDVQLIGAADLFDQCGALDMADGLLDRVRQRGRLTGPLLMQVLERHAENRPKGGRRWGLFLEAASLAPATSPVRLFYLNRIMDETRASADADVLSDLAGRQKDDVLKTWLRMRQAEVLEDRGKAAGIVMDLLQAGKITPDRFLWALTIFHQADRSDDIIRLVEAQLRRGRRQELGVKQLLKHAYAKVGRNIDSRRAATDPFHAPPPLPSTRFMPTINSLGSGTGVFSVP